MGHSYSSALTNMQEELELREGGYSDLRLSTPDVEAIIDALLKAMESDRRGMIPKNAKWVDITATRIQLISNKIPLANVFKNGNNGFYWEGINSWIEFNAVSLGNTETIEQAKAAAEAYVSKWFEEVMR